MRTIANRAADVWRRFRKLTGDDQYVITVLGGTILSVTGLWFVFEVVLRGWMGWQGPSGL